MAKDNIKKKIKKRTTLNRYVLNFSVDYSL